LGNQMIKNISTQVPVYRVVLEPLPEGAAVVAPPQQEPADPADQARQQRRRERLHRFFVSTAFAGTLIFFLFGINILSGDELWFQWPALVILLIYALRNIFLFRKML
ncbi:MAG: hypothetical protein AB7S59_22735, partial [Parvibaculaceae bacterium]